MALSLNSGIQVMKKVGAELLEELYARVTGKGGRIVMITGQLGSGKTSVLLRLALKFVGKEYVIWRGRDLAQWHKIPNWQKLVKIFVHKDDEVEFWKIYAGTTRAEKIELPIVRYETPEDLLNKLDKNKINVVYEPTSYYISEELAEEVRVRSNIILPKEKLKEESKPAFFWFEFLFRLLHRLDGEWYSVFLDEVDDVFPETPKGLQWALQEWTKDIIKDLRKALISLFMSTHTLRNVDWRILSKVPLFIYLKGGEVRRGSKIKQEYVYFLPDGVAYIEMGKFGIFWFEYLPHPGYDIKVKKVRISSSSG